MRRKANWPGKPATSSEVYSLSVEWPAGYERKSRLTLTTIGRRTGKRHVVRIDFVVHEGRLFVTGANDKRDWMRNVLKNPVVEATIDEVSRRVRAEAVDSEELRATIEQLYRKKYPWASRLLRLARKGALVFELKKTEDNHT